MHTGSLVRGNVAGIRNTCCHLRCSLQASCQNMFWRGKRLTKEMVCDTAHLYWGVFGRAQNSQHGWCFHDDVKMGFMQAETLPLLKLLCITCSSDTSSKTCFQVQSANMIWQAAEYNFKRTHCAKHAWCMCVILLRYAVQPAFITFLALSRLTTTCTKSSFGDITPSRLQY